MKRKKIKIVGHTLFWLFLLLLPFIFFFEDKKFSVGRVLLSPYYWLFSFSFGLLFYINHYYLIPKFYQRKKYSLYALALVLLFVIFFFVKPFLRMFWHYLDARKMKPEPLTIFKVDAMTYLLFFIVVATGMAIHVVREWKNSESRALKAETEKAQAELAFLKAQVNPHFLYNTLNNIYSLSLDKDPDAPEAIMKLSNLMRYITDEATKDYVPLESEIATIRDYIDLQQLRHSTNVKLDFTVTGRIEEKQIAPLILMTYIENVFKYGISSREDAFCKIKISAEEDKISFFCQNKIFATSRVEERTGIGQANTKQRLKLIYPDAHILNITSENGLYTVELTLNV